MSHCSYRALESLFLPCRTPEGGVLVNSLSKFTQQPETHHGTPGWLHVAETLFLLDYVVTRPIGQEKSSSSDHHVFVPSGPCRLLKLFKFLVRVQVLSLNGGGVFLSGFHVLGNVPRKVRKML